MELTNLAAAAPQKESEASVVYDDILYGFLRMVQPSGGPKVNMDTVLLAGYARLRSGEKALELGCAHGAISLLLAKRHESAAVTGLDIQPHLIDLARHNAAHNGLEGRAQFLYGDLCQVRKQFSHQSLDVVVTNPPYEDPGQGVQSLEETKRIARQGQQCTLEQVIAAAKYLLRNRGRLYMVMRALRLPQTMELLCRYNIQPRRLRAVHPAMGKAASVFLLEALRAGGSGAVIEPPLYIYDRQGQYSDELMTFYSPQGPAPKGRG